MVFLVTLSLSFSDAEKNGVSLLHGNSITFYKQEQLREDLFRRVFEYWYFKIDLLKRGSKIILMFFLQIGTISR